CRRVGGRLSRFRSFFSFRHQARRTPRETRPLRDARELGLPLVAIGGITAENGGSLIAAGADYLAVISALFGTRDVRAAAQRFAALFAPRDQACPATTNSSSAPNGCFPVVSIRRCAPSSRWAVNPSSRHAPTARTSGTSRASATSTTSARGDR